MMPNKWPKCLTIISRKLVRDWKKSIRPTNKKYDEYLNERVENSFIIEPTNNNKVLSVIKQFKNGETTGLNSLDTIMKKCANEISAPLKFLFSICPLLMAFFQNL